MGNHFFFFKSPNFSNIFFEWYFQVSLSELYRTRKCIHVWIIEAAILIRAKENAAHTVGSRNVSVSAWSWKVGWRLRGSFKGHEACWATRMDYLRGLCIGLINRYYICIDTKLSIFDISIKNEWYYTFTNLPRILAAHIQFYAIVWAEQLSWLCFCLY